VTRTFNVGLWTLGTATGIAACWLLPPTGLDALSPTWLGDSAFVFWGGQFLKGAALGGVQALLLPSRVRPLMWGAVNGIGFVMLTIVEGMGEWSYPIIGLGLFAFCAAAIGLAQWSVLRSAGVRVANWVAATASAHAIGFIALILASTATRGSASMLHQNRLLIVYIVFALVDGIALGLVTGFVLSKTFVLARTARSTPQPATVTGVA